MLEAVFALVEREVARRGGGAWEVYVARSHVRRFEAKGGGIEAVALSRTESAGIRLFRDGRMGFSYAFRCDSDALPAAVEAAFRCAAAADSDPAFGLPEAGGTYPDISLFEPEVEGLSDGGAAEFARTLEAAALAGDRRVKRVRRALLVVTVTEIAFRNSLGKSGKQRLSACSASVEAAAEENGLAQSGFGCGFARSLAGLDGEKIAAEAAERAVRMLGAKGLRTGRYPVVLENRAAADLLEVLAPSFLSSNVAKGRSMLAGKTGEPVAASCVTIADDPCDPGGEAACAFDGEGVPSRQNVLVEKGVMGGFLADAFWGRKVKTGSTGSCRRRAATEPPAPGVSNLRIEPGDRPPAALFAALGSGLFVTGFLGIHTADPVSGDFAVGAEGFLFDKDGPREPVRGFAVSGNVLSLLSRVVAAASDFRWFGSLGAPSLAVSELAVAGD